MIALTTVQSSQSMANFNDLGSSKTRHLFLLLKLHIYQSCNFLDHFLNQTIENESGRNIIVKIKNDEVTGRNGGLTLLCFCTRF